MFTLTWITEKELERVIKKRRRILLKKKTWKFHSGGKKIRNARGQQGEASRVKMSGSEKNTSDHEHKQQDFWWAHTAIPPLVVQKRHCSRAKQRQRNVQKGGCTCKFVFCYLDLLIFLPSSLPSPFSIARFYFIFLFIIKYLVNESFAFSPG